MFEESWVCFLDSELYENVCSMYTASFPRFNLSTMVRSLRSRPPSFGAPFKEKVKAVPMSRTSRRSSKRPRNDDTPLDLLPRLFGRKKEEFCIASCYRGHSQWFFLILCIRIGKSCYLCLLVMVCWPVMSVTRSKTTRSRCIKKYDKHSTCDAPQWGGGLVSKGYGPS